jgi:hypothetical protein
VIRLGGAKSVGALVKPRMCRELGSRLLRSGDRIIQLQSRRMTLKARRGSAAIYLERDGDAPLRLELIAYEPKRCPHKPFRWGRDLDWGGGVNITRGKNAWLIERLGYDREPILDLMTAPRKRGPSPSRTFSSPLLMGVCANPRKGNRLVFFTRSTRLWLHPVAAATVSEADNMKWEAAWPLTAATGPWGEPINLGYRSSRGHGTERLCNIVKLLGFNPHIANAAFRREAAH